MKILTTGHKRASLAMLLAVSTVAAGALTTASNTVSAAPGQALINAATVVGAPSQEEQIAINAGFDVTVVSDATWAAMTSADFGQYDLLIAGDPNCGGLPSGLVSSAPAWGPVVLGLAGGRTAAGNRIVVGTDPALHDGGDFTSPDAFGTIIREGIGFAGLNPSTTGMYFSATCAANYFGQTAETLAVLAAMSAGTGAWTIDADPPCGGAVSLIASHPSFADLTTASLQGWGCSVHEAFPTYPSDWSALAVATDTLSQPTCGVDPNTLLGACGEAYILVSGQAIVVNSLVISLSPLDSTNPVGTSHTVTANVHEAAGTPPVAGQQVDFTVTGINAGATGVCAPVDCTSDVAGNVTFTYSDTNGAGDDTIKASFTDPVGSLQTATAQKHWVGVVVTNATSTTYTGAASVQYSDSAGLSGTLLDTTTMLPLAGQTLGFTVGMQATSGVTDAAGSASAALTVTQTPGSVTSVQTAFAGDATHSASSDSDPFTIAKEDCTLVYTGDTLVSASTMTNLSAQFGEPDTSPGDWTGKVVTFNVVDSAAVNHLITATTNSAGVAATSAALGPDVYAVTVTFAGDANYLSCATSADTLLTVGAADAKITGGGWISQSTGRANFGFNVTRDVTGLHGQLQTRARGGKNRFHGDSVLTLTTSGNTGTWTGTGKWNGAAGYSFTVSVVDNGTSGKKGDTISITVRDSAGGTVFTTSGPQPLKGGNIVVH